MSSVERLEDRRVFPDVRRLADLKYWREVKELFTVSIYLRSGCCCSEVWSETY